MGPTSKSTASKGVGNGSGSADGVRGLHGFGGLPVEAGVINEYGLGAWGSGVPPATGAENDGPACDGP